MAIVLDGTTGITTPDVDSAADISVNGLTVGRGAGAVSTNTAVGASALAANTSGSESVGIGYQALQANTTGYSLVAVGYTALKANTTGTNQVAVGRNALLVNTTGSNNTALGDQALQANTTASNNTAVGYQSLYATTTGFQNTSVGHAAGIAVTTGNTNTFIGQGSGELITTGSKNSILGKYSGNQGGLDIRTANNYIVLSDGDGNPRFYDRNGTTYSPSIYNIATSGGSTVSIGADASMFRNTSSLRYKKNVVNTSRGLADVMKLRAVQYESIAPQEAGKVFGGLIAEELHDSGLTEFVEYNSEGQPDAVHYANMVSLAFKAIQEQQAIITQLQADVAALKGQA